MRTQFKCVYDISGIGYQFVGEKGFVYSCGNSHKVYLLPILVHLFDCPVCVPASLVIEHIQTGTIPHLTQKVCAGYHLAQGCHL